MSGSLILLRALALCASLIGSQAFAQTSVMPTGTANTAPPEAVEETGDTLPLAQLATAHELFDLARRRRDPVLAIAALRLAAGVESHPIERRPVEVVGGQPSEKVDSLGPLEADTMAAYTTQLARQDPALRRMIDMAMTFGGSRGRLAGPGVMRGRIDARGRHVYFGQDTVFRAGEPAQILLVGDGDSNLNLVVLDELGNEICRRDGPSDREFCSWTPRWTGPYRIVVLNDGSVWSNFTLRTN
jgi:hypothetical protein